MSNRTLTADVIAKIALPILENELGFLKRMYRAHESEFSNRVNGYKVGDTISIRRPADFTVRSGAIVSMQDVIEGKVSLAVDQQIGVDFQLSGTDLTLKVEDMADRIVKPAMVRLVNELAKDVLTVAYQGLPNWAGTPGELINSFADFAKGPERLDLMAVPNEDRTAVLSPSDFWAMLGSQSALFIQGVNKEAYREGTLGNIGGVETMMSQVVPTHTGGTRDDSTPITAAASGDQSVTYNSVKDTWYQDLVTTGWDSGATLTAGDVFTIADLYMVNPITKVRTAVLQQFVVRTAVTADGSGNATISISPPIITSGPHQTVELSTGNFASNAIVPLGTASTGYRQNMVFHKNAMALAIVPMEMPQGVTGGARESYKGISVRVIPGYDFINDVSKWRLDLLYGRKLIDPRLGTRLSGTSA